jgi:hypothetical protein
MEEDFILINSTTDSPEEIAAIEAYSAFIEKAQAESWQVQLLELKDDFIDILNSEILLPSDF